MATITRFEGIEAWQHGRALKRLVYQHSKRGELAKDYALKDQMRRAAIYLSQQQFDQLYSMAAETGRKIGAFMNYLRKTEIRGRKFSTASENERAVTRNPKLQTRNSQ